MAGFNILTVSQIAAYLKSVLDSDSKLKGLYIKGEIADLRENYGSGHIYFTLKEGGASIRAVMFRNYAERMRFSLLEGMAVLVRGDVAFYGREGSCQLYAYDAQPDGVGAKYVALEQLKAKLAAEGIFDTEQKKPLPRYPMSIGVVTSSSGAALQDILKVLGRRWPMAEVLISPVSVQGESAAAEIIQAIEKQNLYGKAEVLIVGRGGGSAEDLFAFNDEGVVRAVHRSSIPVVSAVGHETDYTLCDLAADLRAPTPSAAAELVSPDIEALMGYVSGARALLSSGMANTIQRGADRLKARESALRRGCAMYTKEKQDMLSNMIGLLDARSPAKLLANGYAAVRLGDKRLRSVSEAAPGDILDIKLIDGALTAEVKEIKKGSWSFEKRTDF